LACGPISGVHWNSLLGATGFDVGRETPGACRGAGLLVNQLANNLVANEDNYALAA
jgi:hypothetical protein